jgi:hypothetical protein
MPSYPMYLSDLAEADRTHIKNCIKNVLRWLRASGGRLRSYELEEADELRQSSVFKVIHDLKMTSAMIDAMTSELIEKHGLPDDIGQIPDDFRQDVRKVVLGIMPPAVTNNEQK